MSENKINDVTPKDASSRQERLLLGLLAQEASRIQFGRVELEVSFRNGKLSTASVTDKKRTFLFD